MSLRTIKFPSDLQRRIDALYKQFAHLEKRGVDVGPLIAEYLSEADKRVLARQAVHEEVLRQIEALVEAGVLEPVGNGSYRKVQP